MRKRATPALDLASRMEVNRVDTIPTRKSSRIVSPNNESDYAKLKVSTHLANATSCDNPFVRLALMDNISTNSDMRGILPNHTNFNRYLAANHPCITGNTFIIPGGPVYVHSRINWQIIYI
jgi:hypothetical protein